MIEILFFEEIGFSPLEYAEQDQAREAVQLAGDYLMSGKYSGHEELDLIDWGEAMIDWRVGAVLVPVKQEDNPHIVH